MRAAVAAARAASTKVLIDINWRPVFWPQPEDARAEICDFLRSADLVKISDADLLYLYGMDFEGALKDPCSVGFRGGVLEGFRDC